MGRDGNRATEIADYESGRPGIDDASTSGLPSVGPMLDVHVEQSSGTTTILPVRPSLPVRRLELTHSEGDILAAQLTEDPAMTSFTIPNLGKVEASESRLARAIARNANRENLIWYGIDSQNMSAALGDRIIVRRDAIESEYTCRTCKGKGHSEEICNQCDGKQLRGEVDGVGVACMGCRTLGYGRQEGWYPSGYTKCSDCNGSGWRNGVIVPDTAQAAPVTGTVVSLGPACTLLKLGDRVLHSKFSGHELKMKNESYTYMREIEVISLLRDLGKE